MIRKMLVEDAPEVYDIFTRSLGYDCELDVVRSRIAQLSDDPHHICLVFADDSSNKVIAFLHAERYDTLHNHGGYNVITLAVVPEEQGRGVGRRLLGAFEEMVASEGGSYIKLNSRVERTEAHGFYEHIGYTHKKTQKYFYKKL